MNDAEFIAAMQRGIPPIVPPANPHQASAAGATPVPQRALDAPRSLP